MWNDTYYDRFFYEIGIIISDESKIVTHNCYVPEIKIVWMTKDFPWKTAISYQTRLLIKWDVFKVSYTQFQNVKKELDELR